jgi:prepilin-type N-terminal cleavage/methylation domain-containing protein
MALLKALRKAGRSRGLSLKGGQRGYMLVEVIVAVAIVGIIAVAFLSALTSGYLALVLADENTVAESLTRTEFERVRQMSYELTADYERLEPAPPPGYNVQVYVDFYPNDAEGDSGIKVVTVEVSHQEEPVLTTKSYKVDPKKLL